jgi:hypothetical protein
MVNPQHNDQVEQPSCVDKVFEKDEMILSDFNKDWSPKELLAKQEIFFLKDVVKVLKLDMNKVKKKAKEMEEHGRSPWEVMGCRKIWSHWMVRMKVFAPYYRKHLVPKVKRVEPHWDGNTLLSKKGHYLLTEVCKKLPFTSHQIRYQANKVKNPKQQYGMWKDKDLNAFVIDMEKFSPWIKRLWSGDYAD